MPVYSVRGSLTAGKAAVADQLSFVPLVNMRVKVRGIVIGNQAATAAAASGWQLITAVTTPTGTAFTPIAMDRDAPAARCTAKSTITANAAGTVVVLDEWAFDAVGHFEHWYPPGTEPIISTTTADCVLRKSVGADTNIWNSTLYFEE